MRLVRRQRKIITTRFTNVRLESQAIKNIESQINRLSQEEINYKIEKLKRILKNKGLQKYDDTVQCRNAGCFECSQ